MIRPSNRTCIIDYENIITFVLIMFSSLNIYLFRFEIKNQIFFPSYWSSMKLKWKIRMHISPTKLRYIIIVLMDMSIELKQSKSQDFRNLSTFTQLRVISVMLIFIGLGLKTVQCNTSYIVYSGVPIKMSFSKS